ncbi:hypothetical protein [Actinomadura sp. WMMB 499]|uniref:hypothetical protein n=1 Tax=Actinomadura sp. WMMB 499 TaxID=1219491 RepID=UPI0012481125|nr:hypothetical protein [Actinomadura sp. WMMB 499]QFG22133.1 hypothetical protein F7P10_14340 [Actinomadura sp. WMMB 499]
MIRLAEPRETRRDREVAALLSAKAFVEIRHLAAKGLRDTYLWGRDHESECGPDHCGYTPEQ